MPDWLKTCALVVVLSGWLATVVAYLVQGKLPDAATLGVPAAVVIALAPPITIGRGRANRARRVARRATEPDGTDDES